MRWWLETDWPANPCNENYSTQLQAACSQPLLYNTILLKIVVTTSNLCRKRHHWTSSISIWWHSFWTEISKWFILSLILLCSNKQWRNFISLLLVVYIQNIVSYIIFILDDRACPIFFVIYQLGIGQKKWQQIRLTKSWGYRGSIFLKNETKIICKLLQADDYQSECTTCRQSNMSQWSLLWGTCSCNI